MIHGTVDLTTKQEQKTINHKRMEERVKRYRSLRNIVNFVTIEERCYPAFAITFIKDDLRAVHLLHDDPFVIKLQVDRCQLGRVLVDRGSGVDVLFWEAF